jgi:hypothetical protein
MRILKLQADNFKRLKAVDITPKGAIVPITGKNANGKTSVLDAIWAALGGASHIQSEPIRKGHNKAKIRLDLGEIVVTRSFTKGGTTLAVENSEGLPYKSPQKMLDDLVGALSFDPLEFTRMKPRDQYDTLRALAKVEIDIDKLDAQNRADYQRRTDINRDAKLLRAQAFGIPTVEDPGPAEDSVEVSDALRALREAKDEARAQNDNRAELECTIEAKRAIFTQKRQELVELKESISALEDTLSSIPVTADTMALDSRILELETTLAQASARAEARNAHLLTIQRKKDLETAAETKEKESEDLTAAMEAREKAKQDAIARADMPIPGLSFGEGMVLFNGVPFDQASSAERLRVSTSIAMAANPKLRVIRIEDGSLLDSDSMDLLTQLATEHDFQVWIEVVDGSGKVGVFIEDGEVKADNQDAAEKDAPPETERTLNETELPSTNVERTLNDLDIP